MTPRLIFVVPAHGRHQLTSICLRQLRRTCDALGEAGVHASAIVIANDRNLKTARALGFGTVRRDNTFLSRRFNDGIQAALDPAWNQLPADYVVPIGSDDWIDHRALLPLPSRRTVVGYQRISFVREDGREITTSVLDYPGGAGIRIYPRQLMQVVGYRPADEDRKRACDTSILTNLQRVHKWGMRLEHRHLHDAQIVDWKSSGEQLNSYDLLRRHKRLAPADPFAVLADVYPDEALREMRAHYRRGATYSRTNFRRSVAAA